MPARNFFDYLRNNALMPAIFLIPCQRSGSSQPQAPFRNNQFGASLGGPIVKDKAFFYADD